MDATNSSTRAWPIPSWIPRKSATDCEGLLERVYRTALREGGKCVYCNLDLARNTELLLASELDHLVPKEVFRNAESSGYTRTADYRINLVFCCGPCNDAKDNWPLCLPEGEARGALTLLTREQFIDAARKFTVQRRRSEEKKVTRLMAKIWAQRATKLD